LVYEPLKVRLEVEELAGAVLQFVPELQVVFALVAPENVWVAACELRVANAAARTADWAKKTRLSGRAETVFFFMG